MPKFNYKIVNKKNKVIGGTIKAFSKSRAQKKLESDGSAVLFIVPDKSSGLFRKISFFPSGFSMDDRIYFFYNLSAMLTAGISISDALRVLKEQMRGGRTKKVISTMIQDIENGQKLSSAMKKFPKYFSNFLAELVNVGEVTGKLIETLERISINLENEHELKKKIRASMAYPLVIISVMIAALIIMMVFMLPNIAILYNELGAELPLPTKILVDANKFFQNNHFLILGCLLGIFSIIFLLTKIKKGRYAFHYIHLKIPVLGSLAKESTLAFFFRSLELLFTSGISAINSVDIAKNTVKNEVYKEALNVANPILTHGAPLFEIFKPFPSLFPLQLQRTIEVGERAGRIEESLRHLSAYYERSVRHRTQNMSALLEPILMIIIGITIGWFAISIFLPIYQVAQII